MFEVFRRKISRKIFGPKRNNTGKYEIRTDKHLEELYIITNLSHCWNFEKYENKLGRACIWYQKV